MFHQVPPSVCWTSSANPKTFVNIGTDAVALLCQNIIIFHNVKTKERTYYKGDSPETCAGISLLAGHNRYPLFAIAEQILRPSIFVLKYPEMEKLIEIQSKSVTGYIDLFLSEYGYLAAISNAPDFTIHLWNYRTGVHFAEMETKIKCKKYCMFFTPMSEPSLVQYSVWHQEIIGWKLCLTGDKYSLHEVTTIKLEKEYEKSNLFAIAIEDDGGFIVNDYGVVSSISAGKFALKPEWKVPTERAEPEAYKIFYNRQGLLVVNQTSIYFIKKRQQEWTLEWQISETVAPIVKLISDSNSNTYAVTTFGNIYYVDQNQEGGTLRELWTRNCYVEDYCLLNGIKEDVVLLLTNVGELRLVDISQMNTLSSVYVEDAYCISSHNSTANVVVGTTTGKLYFISYEKLRSPIELAVLEVDGIGIARAHLFDNIAFVKDKLNGIYIVCCDFKANKFHIAMSLDREDKHTWTIGRLFLLGIDRAALFVSPKKRTYPRISKYLWLYRWHLNSLTVLRREFQLLNTYRDFTLIRPYTMEKVEFVGIREADFVFDILTLENNKELQTNCTIRTYHFGHINSISGTRNIITSATQGLIIHFHTHKRSKSPYSISRPILTTYVPRLRKRMDDCFKSKYLLLLYAGGILLAFQIPTLMDSLQQNNLIETFHEKEVTVYTDKKETLRSQNIVAIPDVTEENLIAKRKVVEELQSIREAMQDLINYDISISCQSHGIFRKFCLNKNWLEILTGEARLLCERERAQLIQAVEDQNRIRNWILDLIKSSSSLFSVKLRSIFSHCYLENYAMHPGATELFKKFNYFRFYGLDFPENELEQQKSEKTLLTEFDEDERVQSKSKGLNRFVFEKGCSVFEHVMSKDFEMQDINNVTFYQMNNEDAKLQLLIIDALKQEFNKEFSANKSFKQEILNEILETNALLQKIYSNMNCMLCLLKMEQFEPPTLSVPEWQRDENIERIMTVDDSEISAINHRKITESRTAHKSGRMLLWPLEYWVRAIMYMMDGVLEKLWEEEIKKTPPPPEFLIKKQAVEYTLDEQKQLQEYNRVIETLDEDRRKYLRILKENEGKTLDRKKYYIEKLNERIAQCAILKLQYDFAIKHEQLRLLNSKILNFKRIECKNRIHKQRERLEKIIAYIGKYSKLLDFWDRTFIEIKGKLENQTHRDKQLERQFRGHFLNTISAHFVHEINKIYKRRPKLPAKAFSMASVCYEVAERLISKKQYKFPLPQELQEFLTLIDNLDDIQNCPHQMDHKHWETFTKLRRQKLESELKLKAIAYQMVEAQEGINFVTTELGIIKNTRIEVGNSLMEAIADYFDTAQNRVLEFTLTMGQVEVDVRNSLQSFKSFMVMHVDDINNVNDLIKTAGRRKINAMQRVAFFRRQVIYKEWEHKVVRANIEYLEYVLQLIQKCKVTYEFLEILRNWKKVQENKDASSRVGSIENRVSQRIDAANKRLKHVENDIEKVRAEILIMKTSNNMVNRQIEELKTEVTLLNTSRDFLSEEKLAHERNERFSKLTKHRSLVETVRRDYVQIMELTTILELQRLRTYPTLGPAPPCAFMD